MDTRQEMVRKIREEYNLDSPKVLSVMLQVPREKFVSKIHRLSAYDDGPLPIGYGQTMSQPYTVAFMTHLLINSKLKTKNLKLKAGKTKVLEIGTGSGYQAAILSYFFDKVYTIEIVRQLAEKAKKRLKDLGYKNIFVKSGSGEWGWPEKFPPPASTYADRQAGFDAIIITAGVEKVPQELFNQLKVGGILVAPIGKGYDKVMTKFIKLKDSKVPKLQKKEFGLFHFVPFVEEKN
jgi:protein-L-isoaspartate(D-aspartate) O-methyltransferase